jgi:(2Fe-2S) ferredoxin
MLRCWSRLKILLWGVVAISTILEGDVVHSLSQPVIRVCQNKHCLKRNACLLQTISQLAPSASVESSGCLSHCTDGPNMEIENGSTSTVLTGVVDATTAVVQLEQTLGTPVPKLLVAATKLMEQVPKLGKCKLFLFHGMMQ